MLIAARLPPNPQIDRVFAPFFPSPLAPSSSRVWGLGKTLAWRPLPLTAAPLGRAEASRGVGPAGSSATAANLRAGSMGNHCRVSI